jgi:hypothetical protein
MRTSTVQQLTPRSLSEQFGGSPRWWQRYLPQLHRLGKVGKRGRLFFGDLSEVAAWLAATGGETPERHADFTTNLQTDRA